MLIQEVLISQILIEQSRFSTKEVVFESESDEASLTESFQMLGIITPIVLYQDAKGTLHLIDGKKRLAYSTVNHKKSIQAIKMPDTTQVSDIMMFLYNEKKQIINESTVNKVQFLVFCMDAGVPKDEYSFLSSIGLKPYSAFFEDCQRITELPVELRKFCHDKKLSFKHLVNLTFYPQDLLFQLIQWKTILPFTASIFEEVASHLNDYLKAEGKKISDFVSEPAVQQILSSEALPRQKLEKLRYLIYTKRFPTLNSVNKRIEAAVQELSLPKEITLSWDKTLENKGVEVKFQINEPLAWKVVLSKLNTIEFQTTLTKILDEL